MGKGIKKIAKIGLIVVLVLLAIPALSLLFLQNSRVQTRLSIYVAERLSEELQAHISLSSVNYSFLRRIQVRDLYIEDLNGDTLLYAGLTKLHVRQFRPEPRGLTIRKAIVEDAFVNLVIDSSGVVNIEYFTDKLENPHIPPEKKSRVHFTSIELVDSRFSLSRMGSVHGPSPIDFNDFHLRDLDIKVSNLEVIRDTVLIDVESLSCVERSGFDILHLSTSMSIHKRHLHFKDLAIETEGSDLDIPILEFDFEKFSQFKKFSTAVDLNFACRQSSLKMEDLAQFVPGTERVLNRITIDGKVHGKFCDLNGEDLVIHSGDQSSLEFDFIMIGLPDIRNTFLDFNFKRLNTSVRALNDLFGTPGDSSDQILYPWINLGKIGFSGQFTGYSDQFVANGLLATEMGRVLMDLSFDPDSMRGVDFLGRLRTNDFKIGEFLEMERDLRELDMDVFADGNLYKGQIRANIKGTIDTFDLYNYAYSNITLDGALTNNTFDGGFSISDPNIKLDFEGRTDFSGEVPVHKFTANVARARPYYLNLGQSDPNYFASFLIKTDLSGRSIDEMNGELTLVNSLFERTDEMVQLYNVTLKTRNTPEASLIQVRSDIMDVDITGQYRLSDLPASFKNLVDHYLNVIPDSEPYKDTLDYFVYRVDFKHVNPILEFFFPALKIGDNSYLSGTYDPRNTDVKMRGVFPKLGFGQSSWYQFETMARSSVEALEFGYTSDSMTFGKTYALEHQQVSFLAARDKAHMDISWDNGSAPAFKGEISLNGTFQADSVKDRGFLVNLEPGKVVIDDINWDIHKTEALLRKGFLEIDSFLVVSIDKRILADGVISSGDAQDFLLEIENLNLAELPNLTGANLQLEGKVTGFIDLKRKNGTPVVLADLKVDSLLLNKQILGDTDVEANWDDEDGNIQLRMLSEVGGVRSIETNGEFNPKTEALDFDIRLYDFKLASLNPYTSGIVHDLDGTAHVYLTMDGTLKTPEINGTILFDKGAATLDFLNTRYIFSDDLRIYHNNIYLENFIVSDLYDNQALVNGSVASSEFKDFYLSLNIDANNLQCMNTKSTDNEVFYGNIFASGNAGITGPTDQIRLVVNASTNRNTTLFLPLYNASEVKKTDFFTFLQELEEFEPVPAPPQIKKIAGIEMDLEVDITNDAIVQLIFDPKVGDIIETSGKGSVRIMLDQSNGFRMFGDVVLDQGDYLFTLQNVINKRFKIEPGGKISFNGSPLDASIDLEAIYTLRAAPYNLYPDVDEQKEKLKKRIPVECHLLLQGELGSPTISTGINMPTADAETRNLLENSTSTDEELMKQFLSLLVINNFYSVSGYGAQDIGATGNIAGVTASELLSNQLSNWLSQISDDFDIGVNYRPGDEITSDEVELALSTQLLDDRIIISGNVDVGGQETNPSADASNPYIMGDFDVEFRVTDNVSIIAFNRARDELLFETAPYKQGVGISYREEFDNLSQLVARYKEGLTKRKKRRKKLDEPQMDD